MRDFQLPGRSAAFSANAMCATDHPLSAQTALDILKRGGNAMDAAIGGAVIQGLCQPAMTSLGGDCFVLFKPAGTEEIIALNGSGRAPAAIDPNKLRAEGHKIMPVETVDTVTVPGAVDAFCRLSVDHGRLGLDEVLAPAIKAAREGVVVTPRASFDWHMAESTLRGRARDFYLTDDKPLMPGQVFRHGGQAEVLEQIARHGRDGFYSGAVAEDMVKSLRAEGGVHTLEDFAATACNYTTPISGEYRGMEMVEHPPNGQGATAILLNNILQHFDIGDMHPWGAERAHIEAEASKLAYDARNRFLAEPDYMTRLDHMLSQDTARRLAVLIDPKRAMENPSVLTEAVHKDTIYITVVDRDRNVVSLIYSVFKSFGSGLASDRYGINFHNRGRSFSLEPGHPNELGGGKRPMHTIIPAMLRLGGKVVMPFGVMGGAYQANGHARFVSNIVDFGMNPQEAIDGPRSFTEDGVLQVERGYSDQVHADLAALGHAVSVPAKAIGGAQAIWIDPDTGTLQGGSDPRKDGIALGY